MVQFYEGGRVFTVPLTPEGLRAAGLETIHLQTLAQVVKEGGKAEPNARLL